MAMQVLREKALYAYGNLQGQTQSGLFGLPRSLSELYGFAATKVTGLITLPLPFLSFLALPLYGGSTATINLVFFYLTWSALVLSYGPLAVEVYGSMIVRLLCYVLPALALLLFDLGLPKLSKGLKAKGEEQLPGRLDGKKLLWMSGVATGNVLLSVAVQAAVEHSVTHQLNMRSLLRVTTLVPLPWSILIDIVKGFAVRGALHYAIHRYVLHKYDSVFKRWHLSWHHGVRHPFSLVAAYDHPVNYLLAGFLPTYLPAVMFRWHVLVWHLFLALVSVEELLIYSGLSVLPSTIILTGMARRTEAHFDSVRNGKQVGNFGHFGILDLFLRTACKDEANLVNDVQEEVEKYQFQQRIEDAVSAALEKRSGEGKEKEKKPERVRDDPTQSGADDVKEEAALAEQIVNDDHTASEDLLAPRRSNRRPRKD